MSASVEPARHPWVDCVAEVAAVLDRATAASGSAIFLPTADKAWVLESLSASRERIEGLLLTVMAAADDVAAETGARSVADWLAHRTHSDYGPLARRARLADAVDQRWPLLGRAILDGAVSVAQAHVIAEALDALPAIVDPAVRARAEQHLVREAAAHAPRALRILGRKVLEVVAPDEFDDEERRVLEAEEARARRRTSLAMRVNGDGTTDIRMRVPDAVGERLRTYLEALSAPRRGGGCAPDPTEPRRPYPVRMGEAFCALLERMPGSVLPEHGGSATTVLVTIDLERLRDGRGAAELASGGRISVGEARRLACTAGIVPVVLGGPSQPLDLGRTARFFSTAQRRAMALRDKRCRVEGCTIPAAWCEAHHLGTPWSEGGRTDLADGALLCSRHHHVIHARGYTHQLLPNGDIRFHRRR